mmetsp:Transcript_30571/g.58940  ORF Transcript_30571/g.58940 Transcript_30571/m.58940 type:complete len:80 (-) Transcript_30571:636-875(-)
MPCCSKHYAALCIQCMYILEETVVHWAQLLVHLLERVRHSASSCQNLMYLVLKHRKEVGGHLLAHFRIVDSILHRFKEL